jgi:hypothetical protein
MSALTFATHSFTPFAFRPRVERVVVTALSLAAGALWLVVVPAEIVLRLP